MLYREKRADQIDPQHSLPIRFILIEEALRSSTDTGIGSDHVDPAEVLHGRGDHCGYLGFLAGISTHYADAVESERGLLHPPPKERTQLRARRARQ